MATTKGRKMPKIGDKIEGLHQTFRVLKVLKHAFIVTDENGKRAGDVWSWEVFQNAQGKFCIDK